MEEKTFRSQITWLTFLFSVFVIWIHSYNVELFAAGSVHQADPVWQAVQTVERGIGDSLGQIAVPGFFMLSAYLFFRDFSWDKLLGKWKRRFFSIAVPYGAWTILYYLGYVAGSRIPGVMAVVGKEPVPFNLEELGRALFRYSYAPIFWYLYQLILLILISPAVYLLVKNRLAGILYLILVAAAVHFRLDTQNPNTDALFYYSFGIYMAVHGKKTVEGPWGKRRVAEGAVLLVLSVLAWNMMGKAGASLVWTVGFRFLLPSALWLLLPGEYLPGPRGFMRQSLFLYAIHFVIVRFVNKGAALALTQVLAGDGLAFAALALYFVMPVIVVAGSYVLARLLSRYFCLLWQILSGGREL